MPSSISFLPAPAAPASAPSTPASDLPSGDSPASFDSVLNGTAPSSGKSAGPRTSVTGSSRATTDASKSAKNEKAEKTAKESKAEDTSSDTAPSLLTAEELAAMLALMGAPVPVQATPPPAAPVDFDLTGDVRSADSTDVAIGSEADSSAPADREIFILEAGDAQGATAEGLSARDLLKQGAEVIDYQLQSTPAESSAAAPADSASAAHAAAAVNTAETSIVAPAVADTTAQSAAFAQQASAASNQALDAAGLRRLPAQKTPSKTGPEKIAATPESRDSLTASGVKTSIYADKNNFLSVGNKEVAPEQAPVGTDTANWGDSMNSDARSTPFVARLIDGALSLLGTSAAGATTMDRSIETPAAPTASAAQAAQIVTEIRDIADGLWAVERNSVEVRFNYSATEHLSVKVEYRDGVVQTTFRTESPELRDTIAREWQVQVASASEARPYRVADPVFNTPPADARGFSLGGDSSRQQRQAEQSGNAPHTFATTTGRGQSSSSVAVAAATTFTRPDTAIHLHAFA